MIFVKALLGGTLGLGRGLEVIRLHRNPTCGSETLVGARDIDGCATKKREKETRWESVRRASRAGQARYMGKRRLDKIRTTDDEVAFRQGCNTFAPLVPMSLFPATTLGGPWRLVGSS